jgi:O-antigen/teichoic acid export membrane protein
LIRFSDKLQLIGSAYLQQVIRILAVFVMARYIGPKDNGIYALVLYAAGLVMALNDFAIPQGVVQIIDHSEDVVVDTALVMAGMLYSTYGLFAVAAGVYLTHKDVDHDPQYWRLGAMYGTANLLNALYGVQLARLNRRLEFRAESWQNVIFAVSAASTGIIFAVLHYGAYALGLQMLAGQVAANIAINLRVPLSWPRRASWTVAKRFFKLGTPAAIAAYVRAVEAPIIGLIINPIAGKVGLGLWSKAIQIQQLFGQNLLTSFQRVAYPLLVRSLNDPERLRQLFARVTLILMFVSMLFTAVMIENCDAIVRICLGPTWMAVVPLLRISAWAIPAGALDMVAYLLCMAMGITKSFLRASVINLVIFIPTALLVAHLGGGLLALAACWSASRYLLALTTMDAVTRRLQTGLTQIAKPLAGLAGSGIAATAAMFAVRHLTAHVPLLFSFVFAGGIGSIVYLGSAWVLEPETVKDTWTMARGRAAAQDAPLETPDV